MRQAWQSAWRDVSFRRALLLAGLAVFPIVCGLPVFFDHIAAKPGIVPVDPLMGAIGPYDLSWVTFTVLYGAIVFALVRAASHPYTVLRGLHAYALLQLLRVLAMEVCTLEPPQDIIPLIDPVTVVFYPGGVPFLKDLFFSGHTATLALMVCISHGPRMRSLMGAATVIVGSLVVVQHVHWTIDVLVAPVFVWIAWRASSLSLRLCGVAVA